MYSRQGKRMNFRTRNIAHILPAIFWFVLLAVVLAETLFVGFSSSHTTNAASRQDDDALPALVDGPLSSTVSTNLPTATGAQNL